MTTLLLHCLYIVVMGEKLIRDIASKCHIQTLERILKYADIFFVYKLMNNEIYCPELLEQLHFKVLKFNSRYSPIFILILTIKIIS